MTIFRLSASKDNSITNAYSYNLTTRMTGANNGAADVNEVFSIFGQASSSSQEISRALYQFPIDTFSTRRSLGLLPVSGSVSFFLKLSNARHGETLPTQFTLVVNPLSSSWDEGGGLDLENGKDLSPVGQFGSNWIYRSSGSLWTSQGGDFLTSSVYSQYFENGDENLSIDITPLVEEWISGTTPNNGLIVRLSGTQESGSNQSFYTKRFFSRGSEFFYERPWIEARYNDNIYDNRNNFAASSTLATAQENLNVLYFYNYVRGALRNIPAVGTGSVYVSFWTSASAGTQLTTAPETPITGGWLSTGIYTASVALDTTSSVVYDRWFYSSTSGEVYFHTGTIYPVSIKENLPDTEFIINIKNLKKVYNTTEKSRLKLFVRQKNWRPTIYYKATETAKNLILSSSYYKVFRAVDGFEVIPYGTGSNEHTRLSFNGDGNYFDLDFNLFEPGYMYSIKILVKNRDNEYLEQKETFNFRVENNVN